MSNRRLKIVRQCATCGVSFRPRRKEQLTCSSICGAIRRVKLYPHTAQMHEANKRNRAVFLERLAGELIGLSALEAYQKGQLRGYRSGYQKGSRDRRLNRVRAVA